MTAKKHPRAEMPFLDHLEELRWRILWSLAALVLGSILGFWLVEHYDVLALLKRPIAALLPQGKLFVTRPTDAFLITLKLAVLVGAVLASPIVVWQAWAFLSPALYEREKRFVIPILIAGLFLFLGGALMAYLWVLPTALKLLFSFQRPDLEFIITADAYFSFASLFILAFGVVFETPLVIVLLAAFGVVHPGFFAKNRPMALVLGAIAAALLTPPDAVSMMLMLVPLMLLYEIGILAARLLWRARARELKSEATTALLVLLALGGAAGAQGQQPPPLPRLPQDTLAPDSLRRGQPVDTAAARKLGLPTGPSRQFPPADSMIQELLKREGFRATRYAGDTLTLFADTREIVLNRRAMVEREGSTLEADSVRFFQAECRLQAVGEPKLFDQATVLVGEGMRYNTCERRGIVADAFTSFKQSGVEWFLRGQLAVDSASTRLYAGGSKITSSDLPLPDYHFAAGEIKWVSNTIMVARPAILYVRDVPVLWLPFIFQDMRRGRRSGLLVPGFGLNDLVRPNRCYRRQLTNLGYYFAFNDYLDAQASMDWYSGNSVQFNGRLRYHWLDRFVKGDLAVSRIYESGQGGAAGSRSLQLVLSHNQQFNLRTRLNANINYVTSARVLERNSVDPNLATASLVSAANFSKQFDWGSLQLGGNRRQDLSSGVIQQSLPALSLSPQPINLSESVTWSPAFSLNSTQTLNQRGSVLPLPPLDGVPQFDTLRYGTRSTSLRVGTPVRIGSWNLPLDLSVDDLRDDQRRALRLPDPDNPADTLTRIYGENFSTSVDWNTGISLPVLFSSTWRLAPRIGIRNATGGAFMLRNQYTGGRFVQQGKRLDFGAGISPTVFGFFPGFGPLLRIRHSVSPSLSWQYAPAASVPEDYTRALDPAGTRPIRRSDPVHSLSFGLSQIFEAKLTPPPGDTLAAQNPRKIKLLSIQTSGVTYDFERAKKDSLTGWTTQSVSNTFTSDLLPGFTLATSHDLWEGTAGTDTARLAPFLTSVSTRFSLSAATFRRVAALLTGGPAPPAGPEPVAPPPQPGPGLPTLGGVTPGVRSTQDIAGGFGGGRGLTMSLGYELQRVRSVSTVAEAIPRSQGNRTLSLATSFSPTRNWNLSWQTQYNFTTSEFGQHTLRLERDLRRWRATFDFLQSPNGNFAFSFHIVLLDQPDIKFNYDQRTVNR
ncbi:MAG: twin-arginine translocase subunit TatC [Gemmatimonadetes bacterium]|nr:twin-arginine translocase subunit TatC [Gemmatimonadota bacterium]